MQRIGVIITFILGSLILLTAQTWTPLANIMTIRGTTDASGNLNVISAAPGASYGPLTAMGNLKVRTDSNGSLAVALNGGLTVSTVAVSTTAPVVASGFGTGAAVAVSNGTAAFTVGTGTGAGTGEGIITMPTATTGWVCYVIDLVHMSAGNSFFATQIASTTTTVTVANHKYSDNSEQNWSNSTTLSFQCTGY